MTTSAKLAELVEAAGASPAGTKYTWHDITSAQRTLESRALPLARLVLTLTGALEEADPYVHELVADALAAVGELEL